MEPVGERGAGDGGAGDQYLTVRHASDFLRERSPRAHRALTALARTAEERPRSPVRGHGLKDGLHGLLEQLALFRVVARDAQRFPELGRRYQQEILGDRIALFTRHLSHWPTELRAKISDPTRAAHVFSALLQAEIVDTALLGGPAADPDAIRTRSQEAANDLLALAEAGRL
ncbi:TetR/AcrR family transcriptional regulator C-terminal domain-containing protein [Streptomyces sp. NPDC020800]|uniref:TetR/AcrR family transcriptional regulator C-terminal domain-containing protein n=1 Tax=Streptomyces sp. NPDC020800 TaxID=3365092 RepID=UPI0037B9E16D